MTTTISPEFLADLESPQEVCISPDGKLVVYTLRSASRKQEHATSSLWMAETDKELSARQLTVGNYNDTSPTFSPSGRHIAFLSDRAKPGKGPHLYLLPITGGEALPLTSTELEKGIEAYKWKPDGTAIVILRADEISDEKKEREKKKDDVKVEGDDIAYARLRIVSVESKQCETVISGNFHVSQVDWSPDGSEVVYTVQETPTIDDRFVQTEFYVTNVKDVAPKRISSFGGFSFSLCWTPGGIMCMGSYDEYEPIGTNAVYSINHCQESSVVRNKSYGISDSPSEIKNCQGYTIVKVCHGLLDKLCMLEGDVLHSEPYKICAWDAHISERSTILAIIKGTAGKPQEVFSKIDGKIRQLSQHGKHIAALELGSSRLVECSTPDGLPADAVYYVPKKLEASFDEGNALPTAVWVHGGPHERITDTFDYFAPLINWLMICGYLVLCPNYRGGEGHGTAYANVVRGNAAASYQDIAWLVKEGITKGHIDKDRVSIIGWSQGGYMSFLAVTRDQDLHFTAAVPCAGVSDWDMMAMTSDMIILESKLAGKSPWNCPAPEDVMARLGSPIFHMSKDIKTPVLILHGENDVRVPVTQAIGFYRGMKAYNKECEMAIYPREGHGPPWEREHWLDLMKRIQVFLKKYMG